MSKLWLAERVAGVRGRGEKESEEVRKSMKMRWTAMLVVGCLACATCASSANGDERDSRLAAAKAFVEKSGRYMHHSRLRRGMKGYGLTVLVGTKIERFDVEIVSVMADWGPHQDIILARCSGAGLEKTGIISGMSGSPVFVKDPVDGKDKIVGAVAYGWSFQTEPLCGIQPITQMLAIPGVLDEGKKVAGKAAEPAKATAADVTAAKAPPGYLRAILNPAKSDFSRFGWPKRLVASGRRRSGPAGRAAVSRPQLVPLATPLMISGAGRATLRRLADALRPAGIVPMRAGGVSPAQVRAAKDARLEPGSPVSVALVTGDGDWSGIGTVTDVIGDRVLAFGHSFFAEGDVVLPMGTAYVHAVIASRYTSFKLASTLRMTGATSADETVGVVGRRAAKAEMIPLTVKVDWPDNGRKQVMKYKIAQHPWLTPMLMYSVIFDAAVGWREAPEDHTVTHETTVDFGKLGVYRASNISSGNDVWAAVSDVSRPVTALAHNPFGPRIMPKRVEIKITIRSGDITARILDFRLEGDTYRPGETLRGEITIRPYRKPRRKIPVRFDLPADLPEGAYTLAACDAYTATSELRDEMPQRFDPRTPRQLLDAVQRTVLLKEDSLYLRLPLTRGGLAIGTRELPDLPQSRAKIIAEARRIDTKTFTQALVREQKTKYVLSGSAAARFTVRAKPQSVLIRDQGR